MKVSFLFSLSITLLFALFFSSCSLIPPSPQAARDTQNLPPLVNPTSELQTPEAGNSGEIQPSPTPSVSIPATNQSLLQELENLPELDNDTSQLDSILQ
jgi:hypothetical protein